MGFKCAAKMSIIDYTSDMMGILMSIP